MFSNLSPQFPYYLLLFLLTVVLRFIRAYRGHPKDGSTETAKKYRSNYFYFGFELVNVSAGVFILLSEQAASYVATFMIFYVILVVISFFLEDEGVGRRLKLWGNVTISIAVISVTCYAFMSFEGLKVEAKKDIAKTEKMKRSNWIVALPYLDASLNRNFASKNEPIKNIYIKNVEASSRAEALSIARKEFYSQNGPLPFVPKTDKTAISMIVIESEAVVERGE